MAVVLLYHRFTETLSDPWALNVAPDRFVEHLEIVRRHWQPVPLTRLLDDLRRGLRCDGQVALTVDDGYADALYTALPALQRFDITATFFVPACADSGGREFWWDELDNLLLQPGTLPRHLSLDVDGRRLEWDLGDACHYGPQDAFLNHGWVAWQPPPTPRHALYVSLWVRCQGLPAAKRDLLVRRLKGWAAPEPAPRPSHRMLNTSEISVLSRSRCATLGAHTVTHPRLSAITRSDQRQEIETAKQRLEDLQDAPVTAFAYPFGKRTDYDQHTLQILHQAGFECACTNEPGTVTPAALPYEVPRLFVQNLDGAEFDRWLSVSTGKPVTTRRVNMESC